MKLSKRGKLLLLFLIGTPVALLLASLIYVAFFFYKVPERIAGNRPSQQAPQKIPPIGIPLEYFAQVTAHFMPAGFILISDYPRRPYTIEIDGDGKIRFLNKVTEMWMDGNIPAEKIAELLKSLNDNNFPYIARQKPPELDCSDAQKIEISVTVNSTKQTATIQGCNSPQELYNVSDTIQNAAADFIKTCFINAAKKGNFEAQMQLANHYAPSTISQPHKNYKEAYFWASLAEKTAEKSKVQEASNYEWANKSRTRFENFLSPDEVAEVTKRIAEWNAELSKNQNDQ